MCSKWQTIKVLHHEWTTQTPATMGWIGSCSSLKQKFLWIFVYQTQLTLHMEKFTVKKRINEKKKNYKKVATNGTVKKGRFNHCVTATRGHTALLLKRWKTYSSECSRCLVALVIQLWRHTFHSGTWAVTSSDVSDYPALGLDTQRHSLCAVCERFTLKLELKVPTHY